MACASCGDSRVSPLSCPPNPRQRPPPGLPSPASRPVVVKPPPPPHQPGRLPFLGLGLSPGRVPGAGPGSPRQRELDRDSAGLGWREGGWAAGTVRAVGRSPRRLCVRSVSAASARPSGHTHPADVPVPQDHGLAGRHGDWCPFRALARERAGAAGTLDPTWWAGPTRELTPRPRAPRNVSPGARLSPCGPQAQGGCSARAGGLRSVNGARTQR